MIGTIYLRDNEWWKKENVYKMGKADFAKDRESPYITGEPIRGEYVLILEMPYNKIKMRLIDNLLKHHFQYLNVNKGGGTEFYERFIKDEIIPFLDKMKIEYVVKDVDDINRKIRKRHIQNKMKKLFTHKFIQFSKSKIVENKNSNSPYKIIPSEHQQYVLDRINEFYQHNDIGKINWACGLGKALLSILIVKQMKFKTVLFGVPSIYLQQQIKNEILKLFPNEIILCVGGHGDSDTSNITSTTYRFTITTYHSCHLLLDTSFDFKIGDEAHHLVGIETEKGFRSFHKIKSTKTLFMTATEKIIEKGYSMDDKVFGKLIDTKSVHWAIENKKITDYNILILKNTEREVEDIISNLKLTIKNKEIFISCYMCLKSFELYEITHLLLYTNTTEDAELAKKYIDDLLKLFSLSIYNNCLHSKNCSNLNDEIERFKTSTHGIISCVYMFGEGFDLPKLNAVCIASKMQSETRIVQYLLRPNRLEYGNPTKKAHIIIPYIDDDWKDSESYDKLQTIISRMRNVDKTIEHKITVLTQSQVTKKKDEQPKLVDYAFEQNEIEINKIKMRLRYSKVLGSTFTEEQDEYNYIKTINSELHITSKKEYLQHIPNYPMLIHSPEEYFKTKGVWTNWYDFMGTNISNFIQSKQDWIKICRDKNINSLEDYANACETYDNLPKEPGDFYKDFTNIINELGFNRRRR